MTRVEGPQEVVYVLTAGGTISVSATLSEEEGIINSSDTTGECIDEVRKAIVEGNSLTTTENSRVLISPSAVLALTYRYEED